MNSWTAVDVPIAPACGLPPILAEASAAFAAVSTSTRLRPVRRRPEIRFFSGQRRKHFGGGPDRKAHTSANVRVFSPDPSSVGSHNRLADRKPHSHTAFFGSEERHENSVDILDSASVSEISTTAPIGRSVSTVIMRSRPVATAIASLRYAGGSRIPAVY